MINRLEVAKSKKVKEVTGPQNWYFYNFTLYGMSLNDFFSRIVRTYFCASVEWKGPYNWRFVNNNLQYVISLVDYPYEHYMDENIASTDKCWQISVMPLTPATPEESDSSVQSDLSREIEVFVSRVTNFSTGDNRVKHLVNILSIAKNKTVEEITGRQNWYFDNIRPNGMSLDDFFSAYCDDLFWCFGRTKGV